MPEGRFYHPSRHISAQMVTEHFDAQADEDEPGSRFQMKGRKAVQPSGQEKPAAVHRKVVKPMAAAGRSTAWRVGSVPHWADER